MIETIDFILNKKGSNAKPTHKTDCNLPLRNKIPEKVEELMLEIIVNNVNGAKITELYTLVVEECKKLKLDPPSEPTFYRRFKKHQKKKPEKAIEKEPTTVDKKKIEPVPVNEQKRKYRDYMRAQANDLSQKTGMYEGNDNAI